MLNHSLLRLGSYTSKSIARSVESDANVISLSIGEPVFGPPPNSETALSELLRSGVLMTDLKRYETSLGLPELRHAIADYGRTYFELQVDPETQVLVTTGGAGALTAAILTTTNPGDEIIIGDPSYMLYERLVTVLGRRPVPFLRHVGNGYRWDIQALRGAVSDRTGAIIVNSPENPTGYVCAEEEIRDIVRLCRDKDMFLIHDEVYDQFCFNGPHLPAGIVDGFDNVVQVNSMSKKFGVPGLRIGWMVSNAGTIAAAAKAQDYTTLAVNAFNERIANVFLRTPDLSTWFGEVRQSLRQRVADTIQCLTSVPGFDFPSVIGGGMFAFPNVDQLAARLGSQGERADELVARWLRDIAGVAVVPGATYGSAGNNAVRLVLCGPEAALVAGLKRIVQAVNGIEG